MALTPGVLVLDRYLIEEQVGVGGMGEVYRARHARLGMPVAIKTITGTSTELVERFAREAQLLARVRHPNVVSILDVGNLPDGSPCMVMEFLEGEELDHVRARKKVLTWVEARAVVLAMLKGLGAVHAAGIVHRDLKPTNVLITRDDVVKLVDFGIAFPTGAEAKKFTKSGAVIGTPAYMSPEQLVGSAVDARSDLYSIGLILYELLTGALPFGDDPSAPLRRLREDPPPPAAPRGRPQLPPEAVQAIVRALAIEPRLRHQSSKELYEDLRGKARAESASVVAAPAAQPSLPASPASPSPAPRAPPSPPARPAAPAPPARRAAPSPPVMPQAADLSAHGAASSPLEHAHTVLHQHGVQQQQPVAARALVAARLPGSRLAQRDEQRRLAELAAPGRCYNLGGGMWFAVLSAANDALVGKAAEKLGAALQQRYGGTCRVVWAPASPAFTLTPASLSGATPLPAEITRLLDHLL